MLRKIHAAAAALLVAAAAPAHAAVTTTGCASATTCSLTELYAGGTIKVGDVTFGGFAANPPQAGLAVDPAGVFLTGVEGATSAALDFGFSPDLQAFFDDFLGYFFNYNATVDGASSRRLIGATLSTLTGDSLGVRGDALAQVDMGFNATDILSIFAQQSGTQLTDTLSLSNLTTLAIAGALRLETYAAQSAAGIQSFRFSLGLSGNANVVPLPAAAPLFLAGLAAFGARRRKSLAKQAVSA
jgi:hypothetical protein